MSIKEALGFGSEKKVRYAIVGAGDIAQEDMMPGVDHTGNSVITALVTSDPEKARELSAKYKVEANFRYEEFPRALASGSFEAIYVATPNWRHAEFVVPALRAGIHVLCEKPMEVSTAKCESNTNERDTHMATWPTLPKNCFCNFSLSFQLAFCIDMKSRCSQTCNPRVSPIRCRYVDGLKAAGRQRPRKFFIPGGCLNLVFCAQFPRLFGIRGHQGRDD